MNKPTSEAKALATEVVEAVGRETEVNVCMCPPFTAIETVAKICEESNVAVGAQNMHAQASGAYTGEISAAMLRDVYCQYVILGHSERREYFGETDAQINEKTLVALEASLKPIVCVGETLEEREGEKTLDVVTTQVKGCLANVPADKAESVVVAYEPVWAIGTGKTATPEMAQEVHALIRKLLNQQFGETGEKIRILYGGSMKPGNASELLDQPDIDGGLIGGASLKSTDFAELVTIAISKS